LDLQVPPLDEDYWVENESLLDYDAAFPLVPGAYTSATAPTDEESQGASSTSVSDDCDTGVPRQGDHSVKSVDSSQVNRGNRLPEKLKVLFVDDDMVLRKLFKRSWQRVAPGWDVQEAANGETAVHFAETDPSAFHVIFLDQYMSSIEKQMLGTGK
jgi:PleD family two-component response regulator